MITVNFYSFAKRLNSTKQPTGTGTDLSCLVKSDSSIVNPVIELSTDPTGYNYCYIASFSRYYYIDDIVFVKGIWNVYCHVDVLASYKTAIGNTSGYCTRASAMYDGTIQDDAWTVTTDYTLEISDSAAQYTWTGFNNGYYVVGVKGNTSGAVNGVIYYQLTPAKYSIFINEFYNRTGDNTFFGNLARGVADSIYNLSDFIVSCRWYPFELEATTTEEDVYIGSKKVSNMTAPILKEYPVSVQRWTFAVPKHPEASGRGVYMNAAPYTRYVIKTPWGMNIPLDSFYMRDRTSLNLDMSVDFTTGQAALYYGHSIPNAGFYADFTTYVNFGVEIPLSGTNVNVSSLVGNTIKAPVNAFTGNPLGALSSVGNALLSAQPDPEPIPARGGYAPLTMSQPFLASYFYGVAHVDYIHHGRPYCRNVAPSTLGSGYMQYETYSVAITGTSEEAGSINSYMMSGIYYE